MSSRSPYVPKLICDTIQEAQKLNRSCDLSIDRKFCIDEVIVYVTESKISHQSPKTEFGAQTQYGRVIYLSIENITCSKKKYTFVGQKG
jgi:hypothetical protein